MNEFISFLTTYKELIISVFSVLLTLICILCKRKPKTLDEFTSILSEALSNVPYYCYQVEREGHGYEKKVEVLALCCKFVKKKLGRDLSNKEIELIHNLSESVIEDTLNAPHRSKEL